MPDQPAEVDSVPIKKCNEKNSFLLLIAIHTITYLGIKPTRNTKYLLGEKKLDNLMNNIKIQYSRTFIALEH